MSSAAVRGEGVSVYGENFMKRQKVTKADPANHSKMAAENTSSEPAVPSWMDVSLIQKALHNAEGQHLNVLSVSVSAALAPGENYLSVLYRVKAVLEDGTQRSLLVKIPPQGEALAHISAETGYFSREAEMMANVVPKLETLLEEVSPGKFSQFSARCPLYGSDPVEFLVLQDLAPAGFKMADRKRGLGLRHSLLALQSLARFHAASHALLQRNPQVLRKIINPWGAIGATLGTFTTATYDALAAACRTWSGFEDYAALLASFKTVALKTFVHFHNPKPEAFNVLLHGDFWSNNMMFRYEDDQPVEIRMVDFQLSHVASPVLDILYFLSTSPSENVSEFHEDLLLREYYAELQRTMDLLGMQAPSWAWLQAEMQAHGSFSLWGALGVLPLVKAQSVPDLDASVGGDGAVNPYDRLFADAAVRTTLQHLLPLYRRRGWLSIP